VEAPDRWSVERSHHDSLRLDVRPHSLDERPLTGPVGGRAETPGVTDVRLDGPPGLAWHGDPDVEPRADPFVGVAVGDTRRVEESSLDAPTGDEGGVAAVDAVQAERCASGPYSKASPRTRVATSASVSVP